MSYRAVIPLKLYNRINLYDAQIDICLAFITVREKLYHKCRFAGEFAIFFWKMLQRSLISCIARIALTIFDVNVSYFHRNEERNDFNKTLSQCGHNIRHIYAKSIEIQYIERFIVILKWIAF